MAPTQAALHFFLCVFTCNVVVASVLYVSPTGRSRSLLNRGSLDNPFWSVGEAIEHINGTELATVVLKGGSYVGPQNVNLTFTGLNIAFVARSGAYATVFDCANTYQGWTLYQSEITLPGVTFINCRSSVSGGAIAAFSSRVTTRGSIFWSNQADISGGAIFSRNSTLNIVRTIFRNNFAPQGDGAWSEDSAMRMSRSQAVGKATVVCSGGSLLDTDSENLAILRTNCSYPTPEPDPIPAPQPSLPPVIPVDSPTKSEPIEEAPIFFRQAPTRPPPAMSVDSPTESEPIEEAPTQPPEGSHYQDRKRSDKSDQSHAFEPRISKRDVDECYYEPTGTPICQPNVTSCDLYSHNCLSCPSACRKCSMFAAKLFTLHKNFSGIKFTVQELHSEATQENSTLAFAEAITNLGNITWAPGTTCTVSGYLEGYFKPTTTGPHTFAVEGTNVGATISLHGKIMAGSNAPFAMDLLRLKSTVVLQEGRPYHFVAHLLSKWKALERTLSFQVKLPGEQSFQPLELFYSKNVCGDGILDDDYGESEAECAIDASNALPDICLGATCALNPNNGECFASCSHLITQQCPEYSPLSLNSTNARVDLFDTIWRVPGIDHVAHGVDLVTGEERVAPLFMLGQCTHDPKVVQDVYRGLVYLVPDQVHVLPHPQCTYSTSTKSFSSSAAVSKNLAEQAHIGVSADVGVDGFLVSGTLGFAFSESKTAKTARSLESMRSGSLFLTEARCSTMKVEMNSVNFHPLFLAELAKVDTSEKALAMMEKYGTHFYKSAILGGKLSVMSVVDKRLEQQSGASHISQQSELSFRAGVSAPVLNVRGEFSASPEHSIDEASRDEFEQSSTRSSVITSGGAPASFAPGSDKSSSSTPSSFSEWAQSVDLVPVPVEFELKSIYSIIPPDWKVGVTFVKKLWGYGELQYKQKYGAMMPLPRTKSTTSYRLVTPFPPTALAGGWNWAGLFALKVHETYFWLTEARFSAEGVHTGAFDRGRSSSPHVIDFDVGKPVHFNHLSLHRTNPSQALLGGYFASFLSLAEFPYAYLVDFAAGTARQLVASGNSVPELEERRIFPPIVLDFMIDIEGTSYVQATELALVRFQGTVGFFESYVTTRDGTGHIPAAVEAFIYRSDAWPCTQWGPIVRRWIMYRGNVVQKRIGRLQSVSITLVADSRNSTHSSAGLDFTAVVHEVAVFYAENYAPIRYFSGSPKAHLSGSSPAIIPLHSNNESA